MNHHKCNSVEFIKIDLWKICSMEWWSFEVMVILSGLLPNPKLETAVLSIWYTIS